MEENMDIIVKHKELYKFEDYKEQEYTDNCLSCNIKMNEVGTMEVIEKQFYKFNRVLVDFKCPKCNDIKQVNNIALF
jgi:uncharacterized protein with PIN domain